MCTCALSHVSFLMCKSACGASAIARFCEVPSHQVMDDQVVLMLVHLPVAQSVMECAIILGMRIRNI
jgi:hypothetical protein